MICKDIKDILRCHPDARRALHTGAQTRVCKGFKQISGRPMRLERNSVIALCFREVFYARPVAIVSMNRHELSTGQCRLGTHSGTKPRIVLFQRFGTTCTFTRAGFRNSQAARCFIALTDFRFFSVPAMGSQTGDPSSGLRKPTYDYELCEVVVA